MQAVRPAGRRWHIRDLPVKQTESQLGIVDEYIAIALKALHHVVTSQFPCIHGVEGHPSEQGIQTLDHTLPVAGCETTSAWRKVRPEIPILPVRATVSHIDIK